MSKGIFETPHKWHPGRRDLSCVIEMPRQALHAIHALRNQLTVYLPYLKLVGWVAVEGILWHVTHELFFVTVPSMLGQI